MRVAAVQFKAREDRIAGRSELVRAVVQAGQGRDLVVCPEMALTGYDWGSIEAVRTVAEGPDGPTARALCEAALRCGAWVVCGFPERDADRVFNSALVIDPSGVVRFVYRKTLLFEADEGWASPGDSGYRGFDTDSGRFGVGICMDLNDDRFLQWCAEERLDGIALPTNWVQEEGEMWDYWCWRLHQAWPGGELGGVDGDGPGAIGGDGEFEGAGFEAHGEDGPARGVEPEGSPCMRRTWPARASKESPEGALFEGIVEFDGERPVPHGVPRSPLDGHTNHLDEAGLARRLIPTGLEHAPPSYEGPRVDVPCPTPLLELEPRARDGIQGRDGLRFIFDLRA